MAAPAGTARKALLTAGAISSLYFSFLILFALAPIDLGFVSSHSALVAMAFLGQPVALVAGLLVWRSGHGAAVTMAYEDDLTGLPNRRAFMAEAAGYLKGAPAGSVALVLLDIDKLKSLNDACGHQAGDELIKEAALQLRLAAAKTAPVYRVGGDEFAILVDRSKGVQLSPILRALQAIEARFSACNHVHTIRMSFGYASCHEGETFESLFKRADHRLYESKDAAALPAQPAVLGVTARPRSSAAAIGIEAPPTPPRLALVHSRD
jgi:diguanylate cyclase (GGDEF)-like protein